MVGRQDDAAQHQAQHDEQCALGDDAGDLVGQVEACGVGEGSGGPGPHGGGNGGSGLAPQDRRELGKRGPTSGSVAAEEALPVAPAPRTPSSDVPLPPAQRTVPLHREPPVIGQRGCTVAWGRRPGLVGGVQGPQAPRPHGPPPTSSLVPYLVTGTLTLLEA